MIKTNKIRSKHMKAVSLVLASAIFWSFLLIPSMSWARNKVEIREIGKLHNALLADYDKKYGKNRLPGKITYGFFQVVTRRFVSLLNQRKIETKGVLPQLRRDNGRLKKLVFRNGILLPSQLAIPILIDDLLKRKKFSRKLFRELKIIHRMSRNPRTTPKEILRYINGKFLYFILIMLIYTNILCPTLC